MDFHIFCKMGASIESGCFLTSNLYAQFLLSFENHRIEVYYRKKDQNARNPRKIFSFSIFFGNTEKAVQIWAHSSFWARRTVQLKFAVRGIRDFLQKWPKVDEFPLTEINRIWWTFGPNFNLFYLREYLSDSNNFWCFRKQKIYSSKKIEVLVAYNKVQKTHGYAYILLTDTNRFWGPTGQNQQSSPCTVDL